MASKLAYQYALEARLEPALVKHYGLEDGSELAFHLAEILTDVAELLRPTKARRVSVARATELVGDVVIHWPYHLRCVRKVARKHMWLPSR